MKMLREEEYVIKAETNLDVTGFLDGGDDLDLISYLHES